MACRFGMQDAGSTAVPAQAWSLSAAALLPGSAAVKQGVPDDSFAAPEAVFAVLPAFLRQ
jgi:hypothetical protein